MEKKHEKQTVFIYLLLLLSAIGVQLEAYLAYTNRMAPTFVLTQADMWWKNPLTIIVSHSALLLGIVLLLVHNYRPKKRVFPTVGYALITIRLIPLAAETVHDWHIYKTAFVTPDTASDIRMVVVTIFIGATVLLFPFLAFTSYVQRPYPIPATILGSLWGIYELFSLGSTIYTDIRWTHLTRHWQDWIVCAAHLCLWTGIVLLQWRQKTSNKNISKSE